MGLSGAIITQLYHAIYGNDSKSLILLLAWLPTAISFAFLPTIRTMKINRQQSEHQVLYNFIYVSLGLAGFLMIIIIVEEKVAFSKSDYGGSAAATVFLLFFPFAIAIMEEHNLRKGSKVSAGDSSQLTIVTEKADTETVPSLSQATPAATTNSVPAVPDAQKLVSCWRNVFRPPVRGEDYSILQALFSIDMLVLFFSATCGVGGTLTAIDNLGQMGTSLGYPTRSISTFVSLVSIWNYLGRVVAGFGSEILLKKYKFPRPLMLTLVLLFACVGSPSNSIQSSWRSLRGIGNHRVHLWVTGHLYDREGTKQLAALGLVRKPGEALNCTGVECFKMSFIVITAVTFFGSLVSIILVLRTRKFYKSDDIYKRFRDEMRAAEKDFAMTGNRVGTLADEANGR
ncbi:hypothetical protein CJ030_MR3G015066 [Morella rubra]|uniref:Nodulin-like domain-containing protein n=1 Tax=Morella rubra TaxID=262757 RepID=A0A6A1W5M9_9ROSI|nr:hypothetical protein CJ030_MR3G015066 [Morella rubra]